MAERVIVFLDWQNVYMRARESFHSPHDPHFKGQVNPLDLGLDLAARGRDGERDLLEVRVYRGVPDQARDANGYSAARRQMSIWTRNNRINIIKRTLRYPADWPDCEDSPREKGIDVALAVDLVTMASEGKFDTAIVMSSDQDLAPAVEYVRDKAHLTHSRVEVAAWRGPNGRRPNRITADRVYCHWLDQQTYWGLQDETDYRHTPDTPTGAFPRPPLRF
ncbi:NYN domain-containing protein [Microbacterium sp. LjRoot45]|uniref:NYN domain-containing protein n=1 Tax=Microbacterium sp. LjRoot45 TaxID=3342329 RepID=UPI003ECFB43D